MDRNNVENLSNYGFFFIQKKDLAQAENIFNQALQIDGNNVLVLNNMARLKLMQNKVPEAE